MGSDKKGWKEWNDRFVNAYNQARRGTRRTFERCQRFAMHVKDDTTIREKLIEHVYFKDEGEIKDFEEDLNDILMDISLIDEREIRHYISPISHLGINPETQ